MAVTKKVTAQDLGRAFAKIVRDEPIIHELWVSDHKPEVHFWLVVDPLDMDTQHRLYYLLDPLYARFPDADFQMHVLNPEEHRGDIHLAIPSFADQIPLRAD